MTKYGSKGVTDLIGAVLLIFAAISVPGCEPQGPNIAGPVELPTADASQAGFAVERLQHLSDTMDQLLQDNGAPGAVALILRDVQVVYERAFGHRLMNRQ